MHGSPTQYLRVQCSNSLLCWEASYLHLCHLGVSLGLGKEPYRISFFHISPLCSLQRLLLPCPILFVPSARRLLFFPMLMPRAHCWEDTQKEWKPRACFPVSLGLQPYWSERKGLHPVFYFPPMTVAGRRSLGAEFWSRGTKERKGGSPLFIYQELSYYTSRQIFWRKPEAAKSSS